MPGKNEEQEGTSTSPDKQASSTTSSCLSASSTTDSHGHSDTATGKSPAVRKESPPEKIEKLDDLAIERQLNEIEQETKAQPLVGERRSTALIENDYKDSDPVFKTKAKDLASRFSEFRSIRGDGNCFYRALVFAQLERILTDKKETERFVKVASGWKERLFKLGFPEMTTEDFCDTFIEQLGLLTSGETNEDGLMAKINDDGVSNYLVMFLRLVTSGYLQENQEFYQNFIENTTVRDYCSANIEPMFKVADHLMISSVSHGLGIPLRIEYIDRTDGGGNGEQHHDFLPEGAKEADIKLVFLYRHDHYEVLYK